MGLQGGSPLLCRGNQPLQVNSLMQGRIAGKVFTTAGEKGTGPREISTGMVNERHRDLDQALYKCLFGGWRGAPNVLQGFMGLEEFAPVKELDATKIEFRVHVSF